jgi:hypothetical protein
MLKRNERGNRMNLRTAAALRLLIDQERLEREIEYRRSLASSYSSCEDPHGVAVYQQAMSDIEGLKDLWDIMADLEAEYDFA